MSASSHALPERHEFLLRLPKAKWDDVTSFAHRHGLSLQSAVGRMLAVGLLALVAQERGHRVIFRDPEGDTEKEIVMPV